MHPRISCIKGASQTTLRKLQCPLVMPQATAKAPNWSSKMNLISQTLLTDSALLSCVSRDNFPVTPIYQNCPARRWSFIRMYPVPWTHSSLSPTLRESLSFKRLYQTKPDKYWQWGSYCGSYTITFCASNKDWVSRVQNIPLLTGRGKQIQHTAESHTSQ